MLSIQNLSVSVASKTILHDISMTIKRGEIHAIMGPNGSGKSSLGFTLMGKSSYELRVTSLKLKPNIILDGLDITKKTPDERARLGLFLAFQNPVAIPGISVRKLLRSLITNKNIDSKDKKLNIKYQKSKSISDIVETYKKIDALAKYLRIKTELLNRSLNDDFSGGEKKKIELLQMLFIKPKYAIIDEIDTGLDIDALKIVADGINRLSKVGTGFLVITHYNRILKYIKPDRVHILVGGTIVKEGGAELAKQIEKSGYSRFTN